MESFFSTIPTIQKWIEIDILGFDGPSAWHGLAMLVASIFFTGPCSAWYPVVYCRMIYAIVRKHILVYTRKYTDQYNNICIIYIYIQWNIIYTYIVYHSVLSISRPIPVNISRYTGTSSIHYEHTNSCMYIYTYTYIYIPM